jgi:hypothetical protein
MTSVPWSVYGPRTESGSAPALPQDLERICRDVGGSDRIEAVSDDMRQLVEKTFPGLKSNLPKAKREPGATTASKKAWRST